MKKSIQRFKESDNRTMMRLRTVGIIATPFIGYYFIDKKLSTEYPGYPLSNLPKESQVPVLTKKNGGVYYPYFDIYKTTVKSNSIDDINLKFLSTPGIVNIVTNDSKTSIINSKILQTKDSKNSKSTILKWQWNPTFQIVNFFEKASSYGYPWRMMNGGIHEILITKKSQDEYDVWFSTVHEYNDKRDGKLIPNWVQSLHRNYARLLLYLATKQ